jgi:hypothetical protein
VSLSNLTAVLCHYGKDRFNHRLRFGVPQALVKLDSYRKIAVFKPRTIFGYIRWVADEYGTQDWRFFILQTRNDGLLTRVPGVTPAVKLLASFHRTDCVKRALLAFDEIEKECGGELGILSESYWLGFQNHLNSRKRGHGTPLKSAITEVSHAR